MDFESRDASAESFKGVTRKLPGFFARIGYRKFQPQVHWLLKNNLLVIQNNSSDIPAILVAGGAETLRTEISDRAIARMIEILEGAVTLEIANEKDFEFDLKDVPELDDTGRRFILDKSIEFKRDHHGEWRIGVAGFGLPLHKMSPGDWKALLAVLKEIRRATSKLKTE